MAPKTRNEFKKAFKAIKKPDRPKNVSGKIKDDLEKTVLDDDSTEFALKIAELEKLDHKYLVELVAYKLGKHLDHDSKLPFWHDKVPSSVVTEAMKLLIPRDLSDAQTKRVMDQAITGHDYDKIRLLNERDATGLADYIKSMDKKVSQKFMEEALESKNTYVFTVFAKALHAANGDGVLKFLLDTKEEATTTKNEARDKSDDFTRKGNKDEAAKELKIYNHKNQIEGIVTGALGAILGPDSLKLTAEYLLRAKTTDATRQIIPILNGLSIQQVKEVALTDPKAFIGTILPALDSAQLMKYSTDPSFRQALQNASKKEWDEFAKKVPILRLYNTVETARNGKDGTVEPKVKQTNDIQTLFDSLMDGDDVVVAYVGTKTGNPSEMMAKVGPPDKDNPPRTDCHNMLMVLNVLIKGYPGMVPGLGDELKWGHCKNMLMTKELDKIGQSGRGLLDKSFSGNVFDDQGKPTKRILFTGENGVNSHSWLSVNGMAYDPVLGISGTDNDIESKSTFKTFDWAVVGLIGKSSDGWYFIKDDPSIIKPEKERLKVATNPMSFNIAYYLTQDPSLHLQDEPLKQLTGSNEKTEESDD